MRDRDTVRERWEEGGWGQETQEIRVKVKKNGLMLQQEKAQASRRMREVNTLTI